MEKHVFCGEDTQLDWVTFFLRVPSLWVHKATPPDLSPIFRIEADR